LNGIRELNIEQIPSDALELIKNLKEVNEDYSSLLNILESYFTQAGELKKLILERNKQSALGGDIYPSEAEINEKFEHLKSALEDINYWRGILGDVPSEIESLVRIANEFPAYLSSLPYDGKHDDVKIVDVLAKKEVKLPTGYHQ